MISTESLLKRLNLEAVNLGASGNGAWYDSQSQPITSYNPTTGEPIASVVPASAETYNIIVEGAGERFAQWRSLPAPKRGLVVRDLGNAVRDNLEPLGELISLEMGKIKAEGIGEVQEMVDICDFALGLSRQLYGLTMQSERPSHRMYEQWHPLGPIGVITAFNFPIAVWSWNATIAAVCGDTIVWKPSELVPLTAVAMQHIANQVTADHGLEGVFNLAVGGPEIGRLMTEDTRLPLISFTGSTKTGRTIAQTVAGRLGKSLLELGGNNAIIVAPEADLDLATRAIVFGAVGTAGQRCTTTRRIIAHTSIIEELTTRLVQAYEQVPLGDPRDEGTLLGPLVTEVAVNRMMAAVQQAVSEGGEVITGGKTRPDIGPQFVEPTIIRMPTQTAIVRQETFAPILYLLAYDTLNEAMAFHNDVPQGLSSAIFTDSLRTAETFLAATGSDCGIANVNIGTSGAEIGGAFGGEKETGGGRESGSDSWKAYMRRQTNTINWSSELPLAQGIRFES
ncbi:MAG: aldehyde dehydrogenase family protein [Chloroflexota bacterium]